MSKVTWIHLSDWHQGGPDFDRAVVLQALLRDIENRAKISTDLKQVDFVIFTGDLAFSGTAAQYGLALAEFVEPILKLCNLEKDRFFIVPGNHDVNREITAYLRSNLSLFQDRSRLIATLQESHRRDLVFSPMRAYKEFVEGNLQGAGCGKCGVYGFNAAFKVDGREIRIVGLNSAWLCGTSQDEQGEIDDYGKIIVGEPQLLHALRGVEGADLVIGALHHPFHWLAQKNGIDDRAKVRNRLMENCHVILHGHEHEAAVAVQTATYGDAVIIPAGSAYDRRDPGVAMYANGYNICHVNFDSREGCEGRAYLREFDGDHTWLPDSRRSRTEDGKFSFLIPTKKERVLSSRSRGAPMEIGTTQAYIDSPKLVTGSDSSSVQLLSADVLRRSRAGVSTCLFLNPLNSGIRQLGNNRHIFAHAVMPRSPYANVFSLSLGPRGYTPEEIHLAAWKLWLADTSGEDFIWDADDSEDAFPPGWHSFIVRWDHEKAILEVLFDGQQVIRAANYGNYWPQQFTTHISVGAWPVQWPEHYIETYIARWKTLDNAFDNKVIEEEVSATAKLPNPNRHDISL